METYVTLLKGAILTRVGQHLPHGGSVTGQLNLQTKTPGMQGGSMRKLIFSYLLTLLIAACHSSFAVSAYPYPIEVAQPDGTRISILLKGDEFVKWAQTADGYSLLRNDKGIYEYAMLNLNMDLVPSGLRAKDERDRSSSDLQFLKTLKKGLTFSGSQVVFMRNINQFKKKNTYKSAKLTGTRKFICILIGFTDKGFVKTRAEFENLLNQPGYNGESANGSVFDFYKENSYGQLNMSFTVAGPYTAAHDMAYYGANNSKGNDTNPRALVSEAVTLADPTVNYADFDNDNDQYVDGILVIHAGYGEDSGAAANTIWAHSSSISPLSVDGKLASDYATSSELRGTSGSGITRIGVVCHELGHVLGTSDFYDTNYETNGTYDGTGKWDLMGVGSWNNTGITPAHHNPYTKIFVYGWAAARAFPTGTTIVLGDAETNSNSFYRVNTATTNEYFLFENRQKHKFDSYLPGHGLIIYHVDGNYINTFGNGINTGSHQGLYPVCANATGLPPTTYGTINSAGLPFPGTGNKTSFTDTTIPNSLSWAMEQTNYPLTGISEDNINKTISLAGPVLPDPPAPVAAANATNVVQSTFNANWSFAANATGYRLDVSTSPEFSSYVTGYNDKDVGNVKTTTVSGLNPRTLYYFRVRAYNLGGASENSNTVATRTLSNPPWAPAGFTAVSCNNLVTLKWRRNTDPYFLRYRIYRGHAGNPMVKMDSTTTDRKDTVLVIPGLVHGMTYTFSVTAVNDDGPESPFSNVAATQVKTGVVPVIREKWGDVLICSNLGDSIKGYQWYSGNSMVAGAIGQYYQTNKISGDYRVVTRDLEGCVNSSNVITLTSLRSASLYPNPAKQSFTVELKSLEEGNATISLYNAAGIKVLEMVNPGSELIFRREIPVSNLPPGIYLVKVIQNREEIFSSRVLVTR